MKNNIFVISTILLGIVVVALLFTIATLQSENSDLRNVVRNQAIQTSEMDRYYNNVIARGIYADNPASASAIDIDLQEVKDLMSEGFNGKTQLDPDEDFELGVSDDGDVVVTAGGVQLFPTADPEYGDD